MTVPGAGAARAAMCAGVLVVLLSACVSREEPQAVGECERVAGVIEAFPQGDAGPTVTGSLAQPLAALADGIDDSQDRDARAAAGRLAEVEAAAGSSAPGDSADREQWFTDLAVVDTWALDRCGFDVQTVVLDGLASSAPIAPTPRAAPSVGVEGVLDWVDVLQQVRALPPQQDWTERGYVGSVGTDPGVDVVVVGVPAVDQALVVCEDVVAVLRDEAGDGPLTVRVTTLSGAPLATGGAGQGCASA